MNSHTFKVDRRFFSTGKVQEQDDDMKAYWRSKTSEERLAALEITRQMVYGYDPTTTRLQRVLEVIERA